MATTDTLTAVKTALPADTTIKRRPGRPSSGEDLVRVCITLRREQIEWLDTYLARKSPSRMLNSYSAIIRSLVDSVFAKRN